MAWLPPIKENPKRGNVKDGKQGHLKPIFSPNCGRRYIDVVLLNEIRDAVRGKKGKRAMAAYEKLPQATKDAFALHLVSRGIDFEAHFGDYWFMEIDDLSVTIKVRY